jgi:hypothetical protein
MTVPNFFFSYSRQDANGSSRYMERFITDLEQALAAVVGADLKRGPLATFDRLIGPGEDWDKELSEALETNRALVAMLSPSYCTRANCGKELGVFVKRHPGRTVDEGGRLAGLTNILLLRWLGKRAYQVNGIDDAVIPKWLGRVSHDLRIDPTDPDSRKAAEKYDRAGLRACINPGTDYYQALLDELAYTIRDLPELGPADFDVNFASADDAFTIDWAALDGGAAPAAADPGYLAPPKAINGLAAFYLSGVALAGVADGIGFADRLVAEPEPGLLTRVGRAAVIEGMEVYHCAPASGPVDPARLVGQLSALEASQVVVALFVDAALLGATLDPAVLDSLATDAGWRGPLVLWHSGDGDAGPIAAGLAARADTRRIVALPRGEAAVAELRRLFVEARGRTLRSAQDPGPPSSPLPLIGS